MKITNEMIELACHTFKLKVNEYATDMMLLPSDQWKRKYGTNIHAAYLGEEYAMRAALSALVEEKPVADDLIGYVLRYGGMCRDCADMDGVCQSGQPCDNDQRRAVVKHTIAALAYGIKHGFIANPFTAALVDVPAVEPEPVAWRWKFDRDDVAWCHGENEPKGFRFGDPEIVEPLYASPVRSAIAPAPAEVVETKLVEALKAANEWIGILRCSTGDVVMDSFDDRDPRIVEERVKKLIDEALALSSPSLGHAEDGMAHGSTTSTTGGSHE